MKKKKALNLNKRSISSFRAQSLNGGATPACTFLTTLTEEIVPIVVSLVLDECVGGEDPVTSSACANTQDDDSCQCTVA